MFRIGSGRWEICCFLSRRFARISLYFFSLHCFNFSTPLSFNSFLRFSFLLSCFFAFGDADTHRAKEWERERGSECCDRSAVRSADSCPPFDLSANLLPLPVELHDVLQFHARRARRLDRRLSGKKKADMQINTKTWSMNSHYSQCKCFSNTCLLIRKKI